MSINMGDSGDVEYADHEVQALNFQVSTDGTVAAFEQQFETSPVSERGIDSDELAELVAMYRYVSLQTQGPQDQTSQDTLSGEVNLGINTTGEEEALTDLGANATIEEVEQNGATARLGGLDDPGVLDGASINGFVATHVGQSERFLDFQDTFGSGPYVDKTDDLVVQGEIATDGTDRVKIEVVYLLYWSVEQMPEGRASFARP